MKETCEFRIDEKFASLLFKSEEGKRLGDSVRKIELATDDSRFDDIGRLQLEVRAQTELAFFYGWIMKRSYSSSELGNATCFHLLFQSTFEPGGEEYGTRYDESIGCPKCGSGAKQITPLYLPEKRIPKGRDFSRTIAGEIVVSRRVKELFTRQGITGARFSPIGFNPSSSAESQDWFQLIITHERAEIVAPTRTGINPFDEDHKGEYRCAAGDLIGLNILSEVSVDSASFGDADIACTRQFVGTLRGLLRPERIILISPKMRGLIESEKLKGVKAEVAHLV